MENNLDTTINTYNKHFDDYCKSIFDVNESEYVGWINRFVELMPANAKVLEIGSASGRDARYLRGKGLNMVCADVVDEALENLKNEGFEVFRYDFRDEMYPEWKNNFDGIFANAVLLHATQDVFENFLKNSLNILKDNGVFALSLQIGKGEEIKYNKFNAPRYFKYYSEEELVKIIANSRYEIVFTNIVNNKWMQIILRKK